jgi:lysozyme
MRLWRQKWPKGMTKLDADVLLCTVAQGFCDKVLKLLPGVTLNSNELGALICFIYNVGEGNFSSSTVRKRLLAGDRHGAADALLMWDRAGGIELNGLKRRREAERALFLKPITV